MSLQLDRYLSARRQGRSMMTACVESGIGAEEARLWEADIAKDPTILDRAPTTPIPAPVEAQSKETDDMGRPKKSEQVQEVHTPDFALAVRIFRQDIKPAQSKVGEFAQEQSEAYKQIKKRAYIQPQAARLAFRLDGMEESKRDDFLRSFNGLLKEMNIFMPVDLADIAEGKGAAGENVVPLGAAAKPRLATLQVSDGVDTDLADGEDEFGVFDPKEGDWLDTASAREGGETAWTQSIADAWRGTKEAAQKLVDELDYTPPLEVRSFAATEADGGHEHQEAAE